MLIHTDKNASSKEQRKIHCQNGRSGFDSIAINPAFEKLGIIALTKGCDSIGKQNPQRCCLHSACGRTGAPPISIRRIIMPFDAPDIADRATVLKPAVLVVTDWKKDTRKLRSCWKRRKVHKKEKCSRHNNKEARYDKDYLALYPIAMKMPLVFADIIPGQKTNAADHDQ